MRFCCEAHVIAYRQRLTDDTRAKIQRLASSGSREPGPAIFGEGTRTNARTRLVSFSNMAATVGTERGQEERVGPTETQFVSS